MGYVFISYSSKDRDMALRIAQDLKGAGLDPWIDRWKITGREPYWDEIQEGIEACSYFLFLVSPDSIDKTSGARKELYHVASLKPTPLLIPAMVRATPFDDFPIVISPGEYQIHDFVTQPYDGAFPNLLVALSQQGETAKFRIPGAATSGTPTAGSSPTQPMTASRSRSPLWIGLVTVALVALVVSGLLLTSQLSKPNLTLTAAASQAQVSTTQTPTQSGSPTAIIPTLTSIPTQVICVGVLPPRLTLGGQGRVTPGKPNNLRVQPNSTSNKVGVIPPGTTFDVLRGPTCTKDGSWWLVTYEGGSGWTVEGDAYSYYLEPVYESASIAVGTTPEAASGTATSILDLPPTTFADATLPPNVTATPQGGGSGKIAFTSTQGGKHQIFLADSDGSNPVNITNTTTNEYSPAWSPDGTQIVFVSERTGNPQLFIMDADGKNARRVVSTNSKHASPAWSPNGHDIVFASDQGGNYNIFLVNQSGQALRQLTFNQSDDYAPAWSPDGKRIAFVSNRTGGPEIYVMDSDSNNLTRLTTSPNTNIYNTKPVWAPDGSLIAFVSNRDGAKAIYEIGIAGDNLFRMTTDKTGDDPAFSPDEAWILFVSDRETGLKLFIMDLGGENVRTLIDNVSDFAPAWQPMKQ